MPRIGLLVLAFAAVAFPPAASAQQTVPTDLAFIQLGTLCERVSVDVYTAALDRDDWTPAQRAALVASRTSDRKQLRTLVKGLGPLTRVTVDDPVAIPPKLVESRAAAVASAEKLTQLTVQVYLYAASLVTDAGARRLLSRYAAADLVTLQRLRAAAGRPPVPAAAARRSGAFPSPARLLGRGSSAVLAAVG